MFTDSELKKRSGLERTGIPPHEDNAKESQHSSSQPSKPDKAPVVKSTDKNRGQSSWRVKASDDDMRYMVFHCQYHHQMLTLDETTHFFWNLSNEACVRRAGVTAQTPVAN